jgi:hypothetical protein
MKDDFMEKVYADQLRIEAAMLESARLQAIYETFNSTFQSMMAVHNAQLLGFMYLAFNPNFSKPK